MDKNRLRCEELRDNVVTDEIAAKLFEDGMTIGASGFTSSGYPKDVQLAIAKRAENGEEIKLNIITGASVGPELDKALSDTGVMNRRYPYQTDSSCRNAVNNSEVHYSDMHLSHTLQWIKYGFLGKMDLALIEAVAITEDGHIIPSTSVGNSNVFVECAKKVIVEINTSQPIALEGMHDIHSMDLPPYRKPIPLVNVDDRIGTEYIPCDKGKIAAIVFTDITDKTRPVAPIDSVSKKWQIILLSF